MQTVSDIFSIFSMVFYYRRGYAVKSIKSFLLQIFMMAFLFPAMILSLTQLNWQEDTVVAAFSPQKSSCLIKVLLGDDPVEMELEEYVLQVVLGEIPAEFHQEALKAQAIAARTFAWRARTTGGKHGSGAVCTDSACCQGFVSEEEFLEKYGIEDDLDKMRAAVEATAGTIITYRQEPIEAAYFSSSGGSTEDALEVWGGEYPYLVSVESPEEAAQGEAEQAFSSAFLESALNTRLEGEPETWFSDWKHTAGGGVAQVRIGNRTFSGTQVRRLLNLRSTRFSVSIEHDVVFFHTLGYGHRVGMSQYGANAMAQQGKTFEEILKYYYTGTDLTQIGEKPPENITGTKKEN